MTCRDCGYYHICNKHKKIKIEVVLGGDTQLCNYVEQICNDFHHKTCLIKIPMFDTGKIPLTNAIHDLVALYNSKAPEVKGRRVSLEVAIQTVSDKLRDSVNKEEKPNGRNNN